jgi:hypothetical protein
MFDIFSVVLVKMHVFLYFIVFEGTFFFFAWHLWNGFFLGEAQYWGLNSVPHACRQALYCLNCNSSPFCFSYFSNRVSFLCLDRPGLRSFYLCFQSSGEITDSCYHTQLFIGWDRFSHTFCPDWLQTLLLLISTASVALITGVSHFAWLGYLISWHVTV